jgi:PBP1b-binding outer membrane lipoprotein LpoB
MTTQHTWRDNPHPHPVRFLSILFIVLILAACSSSGSPPTFTPAVLQSTAVVPVEPTTSLATPPTQPSAAPSIEAQITSLPVIDNEFHPSDPTTVSLAAGRPQFVEFFAFW